MILQMRIMMQKKLGSRVESLLLLSLIVYPLVYFSELLKYPSGTMYGTKVSDLNGTIQVATILKEMQFPWSSNMMTSFPNGETFWRWQSFTQLLQNCTLWLLTRLLSPELATICLIITFWWLTGILVYLLSKQIGADRTAALLAATACQFLPWIRENVLVHISYVTVVPLLIVYLYIKYVQDKTRRNMVMLFLGFFVVFLFDPYWFQFSLLIAAFLLTYESVRRIRYRQLHVPKRFLYCIASAIVASIAIFNLTQVFNGFENSENSSSVKFGITTAAQIDSFQGSLQDYIRPDFKHLLFSYPPKLGTDFVADTINYSGVVILCFAAGTFLLYRRRKTPREVFLIQLLALFLVVVSLKTTMSYGPLRIPMPSEFLRHVMPGIRFFTRIGLLAEALLCCLAAVTISEIRKKILGRGRELFAFAVLMVLVIDFNPMSRRDIVPDKLQYSKFRSEIDDSKNPVFLTVPMSGRSRLDQSYLQIPTWNGFDTLAYLPDIKVAADLGIKSFSKYLISQGVTHVLAVDDEYPNLQPWDAYPFLFDLKEPFFEEVTDGTVSGSYAWYSLHLKLFRVVQTKDNFDFETITECRNCAEGGYLAVKKIYGDVLSPEAGINWVLNGGASIGVTPDLDGARITRYRVKVTLIPAGNESVVRVRVGSDEKTFRVSDPINGTNIELTLNSDQELEFASLRKCPQVVSYNPQSNDERNLCFGLKNLEIFPLRR